MPTSRILPSALLLLGLAVTPGGAQTPAVDSHGDPLPKGAVHRLGTVRLRHNGTIVFTAFLPGGKSILSVSNDGEVCAWEFPSGKPLHRFESLPRVPTTITSATLSPDGKYLTAFCSDGFLRVLDWASSKELGKVAGKGGTNPAGMFGGGMMMYGGGFPGMGYGQAPQASAAVYSPDGKTLMVPTAAGRLLQLVDLPNGKEIGPATGHVASLNAVWFSPDGKQLVTREAGAAHTWDPVSGKELGVLTFKQTPGAEFQMMYGLQPQMTYSPDGRHAVKGNSLNFGIGPPGNPQMMLLCDAASGKELAKLEVEADQNNFTLYLQRPVLFSPDGKLLAVRHGAGQYKINLYEVPGGKLVRTLAAGPAPAANPMGGFPGGGMPPAEKMVFSPDARTLAFQPQGGIDSRILILDTATGKLLDELKGLKASERLHGPFTPDGRGLFVSSTDGTLILVELATGQPRRTYGQKLDPKAFNRLNPSNNLVFGMGGMVGMGGLGMPGMQNNLPTTWPAAAVSPDGKLLALAGQDGAIQLCDVLTGQELTVFKGHTVTVNALAFAPDGKRLASASHDMTALVWDVTGVTRPAAEKKAIDLEAGWKALATADGAAAFAAMAELAGAPEQAVAAIRERVKPAPRLDVKATQDLIKQLDSGVFKVRNRATADLLQIGEPVLPLVDEALTANPSLETRQRLEQLANQLRSKGLSGERLRVYRAVELLEFIGTAEARQVLQALAGGAPAALVTTSAQAALRR
jgi:WD40 repeat protein